MNMYWYGAFVCKCRLCTLYGLCPGTYIGILRETNGRNVIKFECTRQHVSCLRQLSASPLERVSMQYCALNREQWAVRGHVRMSVGMAGWLKMPWTEISVCVSVKNFNKERSQQFGVFVSRKFWIDIWFEHLYIVSWSEKKLLHNSTVLNFSRYYPLSLWWS